MIWISCSCDSEESQHGPSYGFGNTTGPARSITISMPGAICSTQLPFPSLTRVVHEQVAPFFASCTLLDGNLAPLRLTITELRPKSNSAVWCNYDTMHPGYAGDGRTSSNGLAGKCSRRFTKSNRRPCGSVEAGLLLATSAHEQHIRPQFTAQGQFHHAKFGGLIVGQNRQAL